ncbi:hypothetical protein U751_11985 [Streptococcus pseudopneumoniae 22725]|nr:hypothetical protein U751_11985 [Streptococcus pseudopneumoniae 22725]
MNDRYLVMTRLPRLPYNPSTERRAKKERTKFVLSES